MKITKTLAIATALVSTPVLASNDEAQVPNAAVQTGDLDLNSKSGRDTLDRRVNQAIRSLCNTYERSVSAQRRTAECRLAARASAQPQVRFAILEARGETVALNAQDSKISTPRG